MSRIHVRLLGPLEVESESGRPRHFKRRAQELLGYLLAENKPVPRGHLNNLFWPEKNENNLARELNALRQLLPPGYVEKRADPVLIPRSSVIHLDVEQFDNLLAQGDAESLMAALQLYRGEFAAGFSNDLSPELDRWLYQQRRKYQEKAVKALQDLIGQQADDEQCLRLTDHLLEIEPWREELHLEKMLLLARRRQWSVALKQYAVCRDIIEKEFGVEPAVETVQLYERIRTARATPLHELPLASTPHVGRETELAGIASVLADPACRLLTLLGIGGIGKTRLAIEVARRRRHLFLHDVCFISLTAQEIDTESELIMAIGRALNVSFSIADVRAQLLDYLRPREMLLILDNFEHVVAQARLLSDILRKVPDIKILVTSRQRLDVPEERVYEVVGMAFPDEAVLPPYRMVQAGTNWTLNEAIAAEKYDSVILFQECVQRVNPGFSLEANLLEVMKICQLVEGLPLALELIAPWTRTMSGVDIATKIATESDTFLEFSRNFPERHRSLQVVFEHSWQLLKPAERQVFGRLAVFRGDFSSQAAEQVTNATKTVLANLTKKSMLTALPDERFDLHALLREFAFKKLVESGEVPVFQEKHGDYYSRFVEARLFNLRGHEQITALQELEKDFDNIQAAWLWEIENSRSYIVSVVAGGLFHLCNIRNWYVAGIELFQLAAERLVQQEASVWQGRLLLYQGLFHLRLGQYDLALQCAEKGSAVCEVQGDRQGVARALYIMGCVYYDLSHYDKAEHWQERSLAIYREIEGQEGIADCLHQLGLIFYLRLVFSAGGKKSRYRPPKPFMMEHYFPSEKEIQVTAKARECFKEAVQGYRSVGQPLGEAIALHCIGFTAYVVHEYETAINYFKEAVSLLRKLDASSDLTQSLNWLAWTLTWQGNTVEARKYFLEALEIGVVSLAYKRLLDCLQKFSLFLYVTEKDSFTALAVNNLVAAHPNTDARIRAVAREWIKNISMYTPEEEADKAITYGGAQSLTNLVYTILGNQSATLQMP